MKQITTTSEKQTFNFAKKFAKQLKCGEVIGLIGELGAGKTIFTKGLAAGLSIKKNITSPTFVLMKIYPITNYHRHGGIPQRRDKLPRSPASVGVRDKQITNFVHIDAYRIKTAQDLIAIGIQEYFNKPDIITVIEWADKIKKILPKKTRYVKIKTQRGDKKIINY